LAPYIPDEDEKTPDSGKAQGFQACGQEGGAFFRGGIAILRIGVGHCRRIVPRLEESSKAEKGNKNKYVVDPDVAHVGPAVINQKKTIQFVNLNTLNFLSRYILQICQVLEDELTF
jgi:hypothetical protein